MNLRPIGFATLAAMVSALGAPFLASGTGEGRGRFGQGRYSVAPPVDEGDALARIKAARAKRARKAAKRLAEAQR